MGVCCKIIGTMAAGALGVGAPLQVKQTVLSAPQNRFNNGWGRKGRPSHSWSILLQAKLWLGTGDQWGSGGVL